MIRLGIFFADHYAWADIRMITWKAVGLNLAGPPSESDWGAIDFLV